MQQHIASELRGLQQAMQRFCQAYPEQAQLLKLNTLANTDPSIERLLEGVAYLTGQIQQKVQDDVPEITEYLLTHLFPHVLKPLPSFTILQFTPRPGQLTHSYTLKKGSSVYSNPVGPEQTICHFTTTAPLIINPIKIKNCDIDSISDKNYRLSIYIVSETGNPLPQLDLDKLCFYLQGEHAKTLYLAITQHRLQIQISYPEYPYSMPTQLPLSQISFVTNSQEEALLPLYGQSIYPLQSLLEGLNFSEKSLFFYLQGLNGLPWPKSVCRLMRIEIILQSLDTSFLTTEQQTLQLHCVPAVNLYPLSSEPIYLTQDKIEYPIVADSGYSESITIYDIANVTGIDLSTGEQMTYLPFYQFQHLNDQGNHYHVLQRNNKHYLSFSNHGQLAYISCELQVCNGDYPYRYAANIHIPEHTIPIELTINNLLHPTAMRLAPQRACFQWQILNHLSFNYQAFDKLNHLQHLLYCYDWSIEGNLHPFIQAISGCSLTVTQKIKYGTFNQCLELSLTLQEKAFPNMADLYLFTWQLQCFFRLYYSLNYFVQMHILCLPSQREYLWPTHQGH